MFAMETSRTIAKWKWDVLHEGQDMWLPSRLHLIRLDGSYRRNSENENNFMGNQNMDFDVHLELEGENDNPDFALYFDTIQHVKYVGISENDPESHLCSMLAFEDRPIIEWKTAELHQTRDSNGKDVFEVGEKVHVRLRNRCGFDSRGKKEKKFDHFSIWTPNEVFGSKQKSFRIKSSNSDA